MNEEKWTHFLYSSESPSGFLWKSKPAPFVKIGSVVGTKNKKGYWEINTKASGRVKAHRLVWEYHHGPIPEGFLVDHIDNNLDNNAIENLRLCNEKESARNTRGWSSKRNYLPKGIHDNSHGGKNPGYYQARIFLSGRSHTKSSYDISYLQGWLRSKREEHHGEFKKD